MNPNHRHHAAGTDSMCQKCSTLAYEPSWYATLLTFAQSKSTEVLTTAPARA